LWFMIYYTVKFIIHWSTLARYNKPNIVFALKRVLYSNVELTFQVVQVLLICKEILTDFVTRVTHHCAITLIIPLCIFL